MDGYLGQIANRGNPSTAPNELMPLNRHHLAAETPLLDPFEQTVNEQVSKVANPQTSIFKQTVSPPEITVSDTAFSQKKYHEPVRKTSYFERHIIRAAEGKQKLNISNDLIPAAGIAASTTIKKHSENDDLRTEPDRTLEAENDTDRKAERKVEPANTKLFEAQGQQLIQAAPRRSTQDLVKPSVQPVTQFPVIMPDRTQQKQTIIKEKPAPAPQLIIGRITVQVLPAAKPQVIHKIEKRTIAETKKVPTQVNSKFIFGLGQL